MIRMQKRLFKIYGFVVLVGLLSMALIGAETSTQSRDRQPAIKKTLVDDYWHVHNVGNLGLTITNYGVIGEGYNNSDQPSCEYMLHTDNSRNQVEHICYGGLWVGGISSADGNPHVSTAIIDGVSEVGEKGFEFTNSASASDTIRTRSSLVTSSNFDPSAVSHQDFICTFTDINTIVPGTEFQIPDHTPLGLKIRMESYAWNYAYTDAFVIFNYTFYNISSNTIRGIYAGFWADAAVGNMNYTSIYEPGGGWDWYDNLNGFDEAYKMGYQFDDDGDDGFAQSYVGIRYLGSSGKQDEVQANYDQWKWTSDANADFPDYVMPVDDRGRYEVMKGRHTGDYYKTPENGGIPTQIVDNAASWMVVLMAGPLGDLAPGDSLNATFAIVCGLWATKEQSDTDARRLNLRLNSDWAQIAYNGEDVDGDGKLDPNEDVNGDGILQEEEDVYIPENDLNGNGVWDAGEPVFGDGDGILDIQEDVYENLLKGIASGNGIIDRYLLPSPPPSPNLLVEPGDGEVTLYWDNVSELYEDPITRERDFEGYRIYSSPKTSDSPDENTLLAQFDKDTLNIGYNTGFELIQIDTVIQDHHYAYRFVNRDLKSGWPGEYWFAVTSYDRGNPNNNLPSLESSVLENKTYVIVGSPARESEQQYPVTVFPNPYHAQALWDGSTERERLIWFANLPAKSRVRIYSLSGDMVDEFEHDASAYTGQDVERIQNSGGSNQTLLPGGLHAWDMISAFDQAIATGLYLYSVENLQTGAVQTGKFLVIK